MKRKTVKLLKKASRDRIPVSYLKGKLIPSKKSKLIEKNIKEREIRWLSFHLQSGFDLRKKVISPAEIERSGLTFSIALKAHGSSNYMRILYFFIFALKVFLFIPRVFAALSWLPPVSLRTIVISELSTSESTVS